MKRKLTYIFWFCLPILLLFTACDDMEDKPFTSDIAGDPTETDTAELYALCEGLFNQNNSSLMRFSFGNQRMVRNYFNTINHRGLGDTANDLAIYGNKIYVIVNVSSTVEVIDFRTGNSLKQIQMLTENGSSREPRYIAFHKEKAYVCSYDGTVTRIDTTSLAIDGVTSVGRNPDGICVQNEKLYVSNSGGLDYASGLGVDNTVSVVDIATFKEINKITVGPNPGKIVAGADGTTVYVATRGEDVEAGNYNFAKIDCLTNGVTHYNEKVQNFAIDGEIAYLYNYNYSTQTSSIKTFNLKTGKTVRENFITDGTSIDTPYGINVNPYSGNVYITNAYDYTIYGDLLCFNQQGQLQFRLNNIGLNPNTIAFSDKASQSDIDDNTEETENSLAFANKVWEYKPAPGQFINTSTSAYKDGYTYEDVLKEATRRIQQKSIISLGGFGGYIVLGFPQSIPNIKGEYDFKVKGNAYYNLKTGTGKLGGSAEPGIVFVSKDVNGNGMPDDEWYELKGSEYGKATETRGYEITYHRPNPANLKVFWKDNQGNEGYIFRNSFHNQESYYPLWIESDEITFQGTRLKDNAVPENGLWVGYCYPWGYADNHPNSKEGSNFKIDWAVDSSGSPVDLDQIDFVKIMTAVNQNAGQMGEISTEVTTIENLHFKK
ncbi:MAG: YncE family protein [Bacteroides acidifaciens]|uniref:YncE family protein n=1 Tax=Bacteroides acidifaciens TaxID=85831 RepID=UPI0023C22E63|nr:YncE family protein [Bacteroides acidifaciens]MDE6822743.1 YncE family protein [Bacteroides acidifaciens]MDE6986914.1 YncE family protein [Bacteroides acidifaciens]